MVNRARPHPLAYAVAAILLIGAIAGLAADPKEPAWALRNGWVYRAEVGAAIAGLLYLPLAALSLAWRGETFRKMQVPGGAAIEAPDDIESAADRLKSFEQKANERFAKLESAVEKLHRRVSQGRDV